MQKDTPWDWDSKCQSVFLLLKKAFTSALVLHYFDSSLPIVLKCNASNYAIAKILSQSDSRGKDLHPVTFDTHLMIPAKLNYDIYDKQSLCKALEIKTNLSTAYHLETYGQMERVKQMLEQYLCLYVNYSQNDWCKELPLTKFTYNNMPHSTTRVSLFYANKGYNPRLMLSLKDVSSHVTHKVTKDLQFLHQFFWDKISTINQAYSKHANTQCDPTPNWPPGTLVWLDQCNLKTQRPSIKLDHKCLSPFKVLSKVFTHAYKLNLPPGLKGLYPVFHISLFKKHAPDLFSEQCLS
ncbi:hypothetical protein E4T56_gene6834 [Termitomyces sp. T112]|nr:hypothetical protein E4T56_gene6834 [Termitomyces sp. T112]